MPFQKFVLALCVPAMLVPVAGIASEKVATPREWLTDYAAARDLARELDKPLLLHFHANWCGPCQSMESTVLHTAEIKRLLAGDVVAVKIDSDKRNDLVEHYRVQSLPTDVIVAPDGKILHRVAGFQNKTEYARMLTDATRKFEPRIPATLVKESDAEPAVPMLGLDGYSPVVLLRERQWKKGSEKFSHVYQGITYYLRSAEELADFREEPERFAPRLLGCDPVELWKSDLAQRGDTRYGAYFDGQLFLFVSSENRETFKKSPLRYTETRHVLKSSDLVLR